MNDYVRYSCQLPLKGFGAEAQKKLLAAKVLIVGAGGLGCPVSQYLAAAGIGTLGIADHDTVAAKNLHRQILYGDSDIGRPKTAVAKRRLAGQNPDVTIIAINEKVAAGNVAEIIKPYDIVVDCTDNFDTRYLLNDACVLAGKPLVYGAIFQYEGQAAVWNAKNADGTMTPNYRDVFPSVDGSNIPNCADGGVIPTIAGIIGCVQATEVIKYLTGTDGLLKSRLFIFDAQDMRGYTVALPKSSSAKISGLATEIEVPAITAAQLKRALNRGEYELIDVRSPAEHAGANIGGKNIPLDELPKRLTKLNFTKPIVFYCASGMRSLSAAKLLLQAKPEAKVMSLRGGMRDWPD